MTKSEILEDTIKYYTEDPSRRAVIRSTVDTTRCVYWQKECSNRCAIGRLVGDEVAQDLAQTNEAINTPTQRVKLPAAIIDLGVGFLTDLQVFHDREKYWSDTGLTEDGQRAVFDLRRKHKQ